MRGAGRGVGVVGGKWKVVRALMGGVGGWGRGWGRGWGVGGVVVEGRGCVGGEGSEGRCP